MRYIDGIKDDQINASQFGRAMFGIMGMCTRLTVRPTKHIPITYYKPLNVYDFTDTNTGNYDGIGLSNLDNLKWIDGQPYELVTLNKGVKSL